MLATRLCTLEARSTPEQQPAQSSEQSGHSNIGQPSLISRNNQSGAGERATHKSSVLLGALAALSQHSVAVSV